IYISHAPEDDKGPLLTSLKGWVSTLKENLETELKKRLGAEVRIRRSQDSSELLFLGQPNDKAIKRSAIFLVVTSGHHSRLNYLDELRQFEGDPTKGLTNFILGTPRVFYVHLKPPNRLLFEN